MNPNLYKKNILDLQFQKYLVVASTAAIMIFTYILGVGIAIFTGQLKLNDYIIMAILFIFSASFIGTLLSFFFNALYHIKNIPSVIKTL